jgi:hypothetical protein
MATLQGPANVDSSDTPLRPFIGSAPFVPGADATIQPPARAIRAHVGGTLQVKYAARAKGASSPMTDTFTVAADQLIHGSFIGIVDAGTSASGVTVFW